MHWLKMEYWISLLIGKQRRTIVGEEGRGSQCLCIFWYSMRSSDGIRLVLRKSTDNESCRSVFFFCFLNCIYQNIWLVLIFSICFNCLFCVHSTLRSIYRIYKCSPPSKRVKISNNSISCVFFSRGNQCLRYVCVLIK